MDAVNDRIRPACGNRSVRRRPGPTGPLATRRVLVVSIAALALAALVGGCRSASPSGPPATPAAPPSATAGATERRSPDGRTADLILEDATVLTLDDAMPRAEAVAISGETIVAVGTRESVTALRGTSTRMASLDGRTIVPGFIDAHQHRIGDGPGRLGAAARDILDEAVAQGYTTLNELYVDAARLQELRDLDAAGALPLRVNAYLPVNENSPEGRVFEPYWEAWSPGQQVGPHVRVAGLKVFTDFDNATILLWGQPELDAFVLARHREGWQLAIKTVSSTSLAMILEAATAARVAAPDLVEGRLRLEHMLFATPDQIATIVDLGLVPAINTNVPGQLVGEPDIEALVAREPAGSYAPWRSLFDAGIAPAGISGFPSFWVDEPSGAPFGSPMRLVYQAVTRTGSFGRPTPELLRDQALTVEQALRAHTINAAYAAFENATTGSISTGKRADLVVLSADPTAVPSEEIVHIEPLMTIVGGRIAHCAPELESVCTAPGAGGGAAPPVVVTASSELPEAPAANVIDGTDAHWNSAGEAPQWVELAFSVPRRLEAVRLVVAQDPAGPSVHELWLMRAGGSPERVHVFDGVTADGDVLTFVAAAGLTDVTSVRVVTTRLDGLFPAWREIDIAGS